MGRLSFTYEANSNPYGWKDEAKAGELSGWDRMWRDLRRKGEEKGH